MHKQVARLCKTKQPFTKQNRAYLSAKSTPVSIFIFYAIYLNIENTRVYLFGNGSQFPPCPCPEIMFIPNKYVLFVQFYSLLVSNFGLFFSSEQRAEACVPCSPVSALMPTLCHAGLCEAASIPLSETSVALLQARHFLST